MNSPNMNPKLRKLKRTSHFYVHFGLDYWEVESGGRCSDSSKHSQSLKLWEPFPTPVPGPIVLPRMTSERSHEVGQLWGRCPPNSSHPLTAQKQHRPAPSIALPSEPGPSLPCNLPTCICTCSHPIPRPSPCASPWLQAC